MGGTDKACFVKIMMKMTIMMMAMRYLVMGEKGGSRRKERHIEKKK
jgi:hypothetical protein